ncbi:hypothetical protein [Flavobacterium mesophilum]|uniref:hypothetical protein n=1 Tax=Flavobacterium mesophilum TaxID=3143495 RepID=UPI0031DE3EF0
MAEIEDNIFGSQLRQLLYKLKSDFPDSAEIDVFIQLCSKNSNLLNQGVVSNQFLDDPAPLFEIKNKEITARWREYLSNKSPKNKKEHFPEAVFSYLKIFNFNNDYYYLVHSLKLIRSAKALFKIDFLEDVYKLSKNSALNMHISDPSLSKDILAELFSINPSSTKHDFHDLINHWITYLQNMNDYQGAQIYISLLKETKLISINESRIKFAENYEKKGDFHKSDIQPNTYYPTILSHYKDASRELKSINGQDDIKSRIYRKILAEQDEHAKMHLAVAKNYSTENSKIENFIKERVKHWSSLIATYDFESGLSNLLSFPIALIDNTNHVINESQNLSQFFSSAYKQNDKGRIVAETSFESYLQNLEQSFLREAVIAYIRDTKHKMDLDKKIDKNYVYMILEALPANFVPFDRKPLFVTGILAGFNNDFITAAHLLLPQLENSLKYILEENSLISFKIDDEIQHDNTLGGILEIYIKKLPHPVFKELKDFLTENSNVNFRNDLSHGLASPFIIEHYGIYVWWLILKLIKDYDQIFKSVD